MCGTWFETRFVVNENKVPQLKFREIIGVIGWIITIKKLSVELGL